MSYTIKFSNPAKTDLTVEDGTLNTSTSMQLPGNNYAQGYAAPIGENFMHLLENFASDVAPPVPLEGQLWYDSASKTLNYFDDVDNSGYWKAIGSITASDTAPDGGIQDGHLWLNTTVGESDSGRLSMWYNNAWVTILSQLGKTFYINRRRVGSDNLTYDTLEMVVNDEIVAVVSSSATDWVPNSVETPEYLEDGTTLMNTEFPIIRPGINLNNTSRYLFSGTATSAQYADLAERYAIDSPAEYGMVVRIGGTKEITIETEDKSSSVFGVLSTNPGYMMNSGAGSNSTHPYVALAGRVPCRVIGKVNKGDRLVSSGTIAGHARAVLAGEDVSWEHVIGRALENNVVESEGIIEIVVGAK